MTDDIDRIMEVMAAAFDPTFREAWNRRQVEDALKFGNSHYCLVNEEGEWPQDDEPTAGFWLSRTGFEEEELLLLGVSPAFRRKGLGRNLLRKLQGGANERCVKRLLLEMRRGNPAESLYRSCGFYSIGERRDYYLTTSGQRIDAITFACDLA
ncbi:GNAT family N-acetyltransferase [Novosphingobium mangrovi (ex Huang et al. 2023)]|uniref:GNAT family N-acetyltransferase n=1 Tax=Novosphingobium mangrovi (ex Huang et al. 2023) TaxID=2976432 RepID=A0ABT2I4V8_9SPHN|nr:GNAT family N-acetyltransferase [Novosphingobium mangrovi (ex Huang et al. 2023)]MCT2399643.1 GNAT family N-acetyltransferase [Novosphingobium mangrovi (ex Huang et al. 2023)]